jgi:hypothetical protein
MIPALTNFTPSAGGPQLLRGRANKVAGQRFP